MKVWFMVIKFTSRSFIYILKFFLTFVKSSWSVKTSFYLFCSSLKLLERDESNLKKENIESWTRKKKRQHNSTSFRHWISRWILYMLANKQTIQIKYFKVAFVFILLTHVWEFYEHKRKKCCCWYEFMDEYYVKS